MALTEGSGRELESGCAMPSSGVGLTPNGCSRCCPLAEGEGIDERRIIEQTEPTDVALRKELLVVGRPAFAAAEGLRDRLGREAAIDVCVLGGVEAAGSWSEEAREPPTEANESSKSSEYSR